MAVTLPIITEFDGKGVSRAIREFNQLETTAQKANFVLKKAAMASTVALGGLAAGIGLATKAAMEDAQAQTQLAKTLENTVRATKAQVASTEDFVSKLTLATGVADDQLRPALAALVRGTKDIDAAQKSLNLAMDISTATGMDLVTVSDALAKAYQGNMRGLRALSPEMAALIKEGASLDEVMRVLSATFGGATAANAETAAGKMQILRNSLNEATESIGAAFLPVLESMLPKLQAFADWAGKNTDQLVKLTYIIGGTTAAVIALNFAMNLNPAVALATGFVAVFTATMKIGTAFRNAIGTTQLWNWNLNKLIDTLNGLIRLANRFSIVNKIFGIEVPEIGMEFGKSSTKPATGSGMGAIPGFGPSGLPAPIPVPQIGSIGGVTSGGSSGGSSGSRTAGIPLSGGQSVSFGPQGAPSLGQGMGIGTGWDLSAINIADTPEMQAITININSMIAESSVGETIVEALRDYNRTTGPLRVNV